LTDSGFRPAELSIDLDLGLANDQPSFGDNDRKAAALTRSRLFAEWADQPILVIGTHFAAPTAGHVVRGGAAFRFAV
jgi:hypothetical protein